MTSQVIIQILVQAADLSQLSDSSVTKFLILK